MFKGSPDGKKLIELSLKQIDQKLAYEQDKRREAQARHIRRPSTPFPEDLSDSMKKLRPFVG